MSKAWCDGNSKNSIPNKESDDGVLSDSAFFPSDFGVCEICDDSGNCCSDKIGKPNKIVVFDDEIGKKHKEGIIKTGDAYTHYEVTKGMFRSVDVY